MKKILYGVLILTFAVFGLTARSFAAANPEDVFTFEDGTWCVKSGGELIGFDGIAGTGEQNGETIEWCVVNPDEWEEAKGMKPGVLLHNESWENTAYAYLLLEEEALGVDGLSFRPEGWDIAVISRLSRFTELLSLYSIEYDENPFEVRKSFQARTDAVFWTKDADDNVGMAFTMADEDVQRPEEAGLFASTAVIFYPPPGVELVNDGLVILKKATKNESYEVSGVSGDGTELTLAVISVKSEKDWADADKWQDSEIKVKVPPMPEEAIPDDGEE